MTSSSPSSSSSSSGSFGVGTEQELRGIVQCVPVPNAPFTNPCAANDGQLFASDLVFNNSVDGAASAGPAHLLLLQFFLYSSFRASRRLFADLASC